MAIFRAPRVRFDHFSCEAPDWEHLRDWADHMARGRRRSGLGHRPPWPGQRHLPDGARHGRQHGRDFIRSRGLRAGPPGRRLAASPADLEPVGRRDHAQLSAGPPLTTTGKVLQVLRLFNDERKQLRAADAAAILGLSSATTYRYLADLEGAGLIERTPPTTTSWTDHRRTRPADPH